MHRFRLFLILFSSLVASQVANALPGYSGTIIGCSETVINVPFSSDPFNVSRTASRPSTVGSCTGGGAIRANAQSIGVRYGIDSDRNTAQGRSDAYSVVDDFIVTAQPGLPTIVNAVFRFEVHGTYSASALNLQGPNYGAQARAGFSARAAVSNAPSVLLNREVEVFNQTSFSEVPPPQTWTLVTGPVRLFVGQPFPIQLTMSAYGLVAMAATGYSMAGLAPGTLGGAADSNLFNTFGLARSGAFVTFDQPGYSLQSQSAGIVDSAWLPVPEPSSLLLLGFGLALTASQKPRNRVR